MISLQGGGSLIDSPGVRDYAPALSDVTDAAVGFRENRRGSSIMSIRQLSPPA